MDATRRELIRILQSAYSGELAAAYAYRGHWKSLSNLTEKEMVYIIEDDEWAHRRQLKQMLDYLGSRPQRFREIVMWLTGRMIGLTCYVTGWFLPMYFAGRLEGGNVLEYEAASLHAGRLGLKGFEEELRQMAVAERNHELFFMNAVQGHRLRPLMRAIFRWG
jgi:demethoxyubiquinone hydroxylase (CLK1/Coq7/Cat5 family)